MGKNVIFYFSGTGNSLVVAKETAKSLIECEVVSLSHNPGYLFSGKYDRIGFVYPAYFMGIPLKVREFISTIKLPDNQSAYFFAIATYGGIAGNAISNLNDVLKKKSGHLHFGATIKMFSNYVVLYDMKGNIDEITKESRDKLIPIIDDIKNKRNNSINKSNLIVDMYYNYRARKIPMMDSKFFVTDQCNSCGICKEVCPVSNIIMVNNKPNFNHHCEQCMACIQFCPKRVINYKNKTQKRGRYTNPNIKYKDMVQINNGKV